MVKYILFDLDGTLTDPKVGITTSVQYALAQFGIQVEAPDSLACFIGPPLLDSFREECGFDEATAQAAVVKYRERFGTQGLYENQIYPGIPEMLDRFVQSGFTMGVANSKLETYAVQILEHFSLAPYFKVEVGSLPDNSRGEKKEVIAEALHQLGARPDQTVMVGDRKYDILGAKANGVASIGVRYGYAAPGELEAAGADFVVQSVEELSRLLEKLR